MELETQLRKETEKWLVRIEEKKVKIINKRGKEILENINAYIKDCKHFLKKKDLIRAFEAIVWAWAWLEISKELNILNFD